MSNNHAQQVVQKLWNYCNVLRDDGLSYLSYLEQLTFLLFLKMMDERSKPPFNEKRRIPKAYDWEPLKSKDGLALEDHYRHTLERLGNEKGMLGVIFKKARSEIQDPAKLRKLIVDLIDPEEWMSLETDVKGDAYEGLLEKNAEDTKSGAGQYFTPRALIQALVDVMQPKPGERGKRKATWSEKNPDGRWRAYAYEELLKRDKVSLEESANLPEPEVIAGKIIEDLRAALEQFEEIEADLAGGEA